MISDLMLWFQLISFQFSHSHFEDSVDAGFLPRMLQHLVHLPPLHHLRILLPLKRSLFSRLWMKCGHSLCGRLSFTTSSSSLFMDSASSLSTSAFHIRIHLHHHHPHHLSSLLCLYLDTPTFHYDFGLCICFEWHGFVLIVWYFMDNMLFPYALDIFGLMCCIEISITNHMCWLNIDLCIVLLQ